MKTNRGQRRILVERAVLQKDNPMSDHVRALCDDVEELAVMLELALPFIDQGPLKAKITHALKV